MRAIFTCLLVATTVAAQAGERHTVHADRDATLFEHPEGALASGAGPALFVGRTGQPQNSRRRAVVHFDLSGLPRNAIVESAELVLEVEVARPGVTVGVHRLRATWGEGASISAGGGGAPAAPGDATWVHRHYEAPPPAPRASPNAVHAEWRAAGGDFASQPSASATVGSPGPRAWTGAELVADVQDWLRNPRKNHGWLLLGDESSPRTVLRIASRQGLLLSAVPRLELVLRAPGRRGR